MPRNHGRTHAANASTAARLVAVGYVRCSTDRQEQSIPDQKRAIERYALEHDIRLDRFYEDDAISGTTSAGRRAFQQMISDAGQKHRQWSLIIVYDVKRFGRVDNDEAGYYRHLLRTHGVEVQYISEGFNGDESDDLLRPVKQWQARQESKDLAKVTIRGLLSKATLGLPPQGTIDGGQVQMTRTVARPGRERAARGGEWMGGVPPVGYDLRYANDRGEFLFVLRYLRDGRKHMLDARQGIIRTLARGESVNITKRDRATLVLGESSRVEIVREIFRMYTKEGRGLKAISNALNGRHVPTPRGPEWSARCAGLWRDSTVRAILVNPIYAGDMVWNRRTDARFFSIKGGVAIERRTPHGARLVPNAVQDWIVTRDAHQAIVDRRTFERAQMVREDRPESAVQRDRSRATGATWNGARARFLLSGLIRCAACGCRHQGVTRTKGRPRDDGTLVRNFYYGCGGYIAKGRNACAFNAVPQAHIEGVVCREVLGFYQRYAGAAGQKALAKAVAARLGVESQDLERSRRNVTKEHQQVEAAIAKLLDNMTPKNRDLVEERLATLRAKRETARLRGEELERMAHSEGQVAELASEIGRFLHDLEFTLNHGLNEEKQVAIRRAVRLIRLGSEWAEIQIRVLPTAVDDDGGIVTVRAAMAAHVTKPR